MSKELKHFIKDNNIYYLVDDEMNIYLSIELVHDQPGQVIIKSKDFVYAGPIEFLKFE